MSPRYTHTNTQSHTHAHTQTHTQTHTKTHSHTQTHTHINTHKQTRHTCRKPAGASGFASKPDAWKKHTFKGKIEIKHLHHIPYIYIQRCIHTYISNVHYKVGIIFCFFFWFVLLPLHFDLKCNFYFLPQEGCDIL